MGRLFGLNTPAPASARVLELGCADGSNLLPMAQHAPGGRFLGIDAASKHVEAARSAIAAAGLTNVEVRCQDLMDFPASEGKFDYIIAHGLFSWVSDQVRAKILAICREHLTENGVAYVSYNALPGWGMRMGLREMMLFHTAGMTDAKARVGQARALTAFLAEAVPTEGNPYGLLLKQESQRMATQPDGYIRHDILGDTNQPFYFHQFMQHAMGAGLQYLGEPSLDQMLAANFSEKVAKTLEGVSGNIIAKEQYMDFVRNRSFRKTLLCQHEATLARNINADSIKSFYYTSQIARPEVGTLDLNPGVSHVFKLRTRSNILINADSSFVKAAFETLSGYGLRRISFGELLEAARTKTAAISELRDAPNRAALEEATLAANLLPLYTRGIIDIFADRPVFAQTIPEKPHVTPLARHQAMHSRQITNLAHQPVSLELVERYVVAACDGEKNQAELVDSLFALTRDGKLRLSENEQPVQDESRVRAILQDAVARTVGQITALGFVAE